MADYVEDVAITEENFGPVIIEHLKGNYFKVEFNYNHKKWFTDSRKVLLGGTVGEVNRQFVHKRLDEAIDHFLTRETRNG